MSLHYYWTTMEVEIDERFSLLCCGGQEKIVKLNIDLLCKL